MAISVLNSHPDDAQKSNDHYDDKTKTFFNPWPGHAKPSGWEFIKWFWKNKREQWPKTLVETKTKKPAAHVHEKLVVTPVGHACILIQMDGLNILTDPMYSDVAGIWNYLGPQRVKKPFIDFDDLPKIHVAIVSHNHYDHLDVPTLNRLVKRDNPQIITSLGNKEYLKGYGIHNVKEIDWWETVEIGSVKITGVPAYHWSKRSLFDTNKTLWMGTVIHNQKYSVYFAGDTGESPHFQEIANKFPHLDVALLPIGAYKPRHLMKSSHIGPHEAVEAHKVLKTKYSLPIHFGVFPLGGEKFGEAEEDLIEECQKQGVPLENFPIIDQGDYLEISK